ncbi:MAG TPA: TetR/AcrR family transcriptional regulator [Cytophagaceae bacterium]|jgi:AcrR family transcriptional regulator
MAKKEIDSSTEEKIRIAAKKIFTQKGYSGTRTRDIAEEAGINLALLNYYFRSKEKLFEIIILEIMQGFVKGMKGIFNNEHSTFEEKIEGFVSNYIDLLIANPDIPIFMLNEIRTNAEGLNEKVGFKEHLLKSYFFKQMMEEMQKGTIVQRHPLHIVMNMVSLTVFPFVASPVLKQIGHMKDKEFITLMQERKKLVPKWIKAMLETK